MARDARERRSELPAPKQTIADFLSAAEAMDPLLWEATWQRALVHLSDVVSETPPAGESAPQSFMEIFFRRLSSWFRRFLADRRIPSEVERIERDDAAADGRIVNRRRSVGVTARVG